jgi:5'-nucleotidase
MALTVAERVAAAPPGPFTLINVNVPNLPAESIEGVSVTHQGRREYTDRIVRRMDPRHRSYYWISGALKDDERPNGSDISAIRRRHVSVTPLGIDMTNNEMMPRLAEWWP